MNEFKRKRDSFESEGSSQGTIFDLPLTSLDAPESPLSDYPDSLSECSEARASKRIKWIQTPPGREPEPQPRPSINLHSLSPLSPRIEAPQILSIVKHLDGPQIQEAEIPPITATQPLEVAELSSSQVEEPQTLEVIKPGTPQAETLQASKLTQSPIRQIQEPQIPPFQGPVTLQSLLPPTSTPGQRLGVSLQAVAQALVALSARRSPKPDPSGRPEVWAETRQELCETLHYFRSYHGGGYTSGGLAWGFMFDKSAHARDYIDSTVVISRSGGGMVRNKESGEMVMGGDQTESNQAISLRNSMRHFNPVVIITGSENPSIPSKPPHAYCVLDYFKPTHIWSEKSNGKTMVRYRFEKLNTKKPSWWKPKDATEPELGESHPPVVHRCSVCHLESQQIYLQGWMCLRPTCAAFWKLGDGTEPREEVLLYDPRFLKQKTMWPNDNRNYPLTSNSIELSSHAIPGEDCSRACWAGMVCPDCGRCVLRLSWMAWECSCGFRKAPPHIFIPAKALRDPYFPLTTECTLSRDFHLPHVGLEVSFEHNYRINKYTIPGIHGFVAHLIANKVVVEEPSGPDDMFEELQTTDIGLRRRPLGTGLIKGESYTRHFSVNYGMPYKFIAATASKSFDGAIHAITDTRSRLNWASKFIVKETHQEFNEVLALGYFEQQKINYHDDGEFGLGPTIATLSLGAPGTMRLRMKARHYNGVSTHGVYNDTLPMPGCEKYAERLAAIGNLCDLKEKDGKGYRARLKTLPKEMGLKAGGQAKDAATMMLGHGDIVIMHGADIQKYYEHAVEHAGKLRFAFTCRYIDPGSLKNEDKPQYEVAPDLGMYDGEKVTAKGSKVGSVTRVDASNDGARPGSRAQPAAKIPALSTFTKRPKRGRRKKSLIAKLKLQPQLLEAF